MPCLRKTDPLDGRPCGKHREPCDRPERHVPAEWVARRLPAPLEPGAAHLPSGNSVIALINC